MWTDIAVSLAAPHPAAPELPLGASRQAIYERGDRSAEGRTGRRARARRPPGRPWHGLQVAEVWMLFVIPVVLMSALLVASPGVDFPVGDGVVLSLMFTAMWVPLMWVRTRGGPKH